MALGCGLGIKFFKSFPGDSNGLDTELPKSRDYDLFNFVFPDTP